MEIPATGKTTKTPETRTMKSSTTIEAPIYIFRAIPVQTLTGLDGPWRLRLQDI
jgi:hypothetical protein